MAALQEQHPRTTGGRGALEDALAAVARRLRLARWVRHASRGVLAAVAVSLVGIVCDHFDLLPDWLPLFVFIPALVAIGLLVGTITTFLRPINPMDVARLAEMRLGLKERLSSALEFERAPDAPAAPEEALFRRLQQQDAREYAGRLKAADAAPLRLTWETKALGPALLLLVLALVLPNLPVLVPPAVLIERAVVKKEGQKLERTARLIQKQAEAKNLPATKRAALNMQKLGRRMAQGRMDKKQAMVRIAQLTKQMQEQQKQLAQQAGQASLGGGKSLAQAGQQLSAALQSQPSNGQNGQGASKMQGANAGGSKSTGAKGGQNGANHPGGQAGSHGFNLPGRSKPADKSGRNPQGQPSGAQPTPEMKQIAQAMQQNNAQTLSEQLRQLAQKTASSQLSPQQQRQAAQDLQKLANALQGTGMPETQQHVQAAARAMARGDKQTAAAEMRKAADAAERESQAQQDAQGMQDAQNSLQDGQGEMAGAQDAGDIPEGNGQGKGQGNRPGKGDQPGNGPPEDDTPGNGGQGAGRGKPNTSYHKGQKPNHRIRQKPGVGADAPHWLNPNFDPSKNARYKRLYFGKPRTAGPSQAGTTRKTRPGESDGPVASTVPYYNSVVNARKTAENAMDREDIPPAYKKNVSDYFNSLQPQAAPGTSASGGSPH